MAITDGDVIASNDLATAFDSRMGLLNLSKLLGNRANVFSHKRTISNASALLLRRRRFVPAQDMRVNYIRIGATGAAVGPSSLLHCRLNCRHICRHPRR